MRQIETLAAPERGLFVPEQTDLYLRPINIENDRRQGAASPSDSDRLLGGGPRRFQHVEVILRSAARIVGFSGSIDALREWALTAGCQDEFDAAMFKLTRRQGQLVSGAGDLPLVRSY